MASEADYAWHRINIEKQKQKQIENDIQLLDKSIEHARNADEELQLHRELRAAQQALAQQKAKVQQQQHAENQHLGHNSAFALHLDDPNHPFQRLDQTSSRVWRAIQATAMHRQNFVPT